MNISLGRAAGLTAPEWQRVEYHPCSLVCRGHIRVLDAKAESGDFCTIQQTGNPPRTGWVCQLCWTAYLMARVRRPSLGLHVTKIAESA